MRRLGAVLLATTSLHSIYALADRVGDLSEGLSSSEFIITERASIFPAPFTRSFPRLFESIARKHDMECRYNLHTNEVMRPPYPTLECGPRDTRLVALQPSWDGHYYVFQSEWFQEGCRTSNPYTMKQLKVIADEFSADFHSALVKSWRVKLIVSGRRKDTDLLYAPCPGPPPPDLEE